MKIQLDECISYKVASAVIALANRKGVEVSYVREFNQKRTPDPEWIARFAAEGGTAIISGDHGILQHWPNLIAYTESGLISFFPPFGFPKLKAYGQAASLIRWWPVTCSPSVLRGQ